eukprot:TRINITY_DN8284_c0_g1_i2.p1 TRINITY_DN8284_c0_g1~~TRINITY_DN8284_c0_g1_i2.p1  ORF type:complete len:140 (+),score=4.17 TRINITY_DN8284_c0_g1_i2:96-515(+)
MGPQLKKFYFSCLDSKAAIKFPQFLASVIGIVLEVFLPPVLKKVYSQLSRADSKVAYSQLVNRPLTTQVSVFCTRIVTAASPARVRGIFQTVTISWLLVLYIATAIPKSAAASITTAMKTCESTNPVTEFIAAITQNWE